MSEQQSRLPESLAVLSVFFLVFAGVLAGYLVYLAAHLLALIRYPGPPVRVPSSNSAPLPFITVLVPARNEARRIGPCLEALARQTYPACEVLFIDDHSDDNTAQLIETAIRNHPEAPFRLLRLADMPGAGAGKKAALTAGIAEARGGLLVTTDADCQPPPGWLTVLASYFDDATGLVAGPVAMTGRGGFARLQALEFLGLQALAAGGIRMGLPALCNGANLAFRKSVFEAVGGYTGNTHRASGDDVFLLEKIARQPHLRLRYAWTPAALVRTPAETRWRAFWQQRMRWAGKTPAYRHPLTRLAMAVVFLSQGLLVAGGVCGFLWPAFAPVYLTVLGLKCALDAALLAWAGRRLGQLGLLVWFPLLQIGYPFYVLLSGLAGLLSRNYLWRGRRVR